MERISIAKTMDENVIKNISSLDINIQKAIEEIIEIMDIEYRFLLDYRRIMRIEPNIEIMGHTSLIGQALHKNLFSLYSSIKLTKEGLYGSARILMRHVFELLIISKYAALTGSASFVEKWVKGENVSIKNTVFKRLIHSDISEIERFWGVLCKYTHGTIFSQQDEVGSESNKRETMLNIVYLKMLFEMNYHILNTYFLNPSMRYYTNQIHENSIMLTNEMDYWNIDKKRLKFLFRNKEDMTKEAKMVVYKFRLKWDLIPLKKPESKDQNHPLTSPLQYE